jgi:hypothetical protein
MQAKGVSIWLTPEGPEARRWAALVSELSCRFGTPAFAPHVTLMAGLALHPDAVIGRCRELARGLHPIPIRFLGVQRGADFFRALYTLASPTCRSSTRASAPRRSSPRTPASRSCRT